MYALEKVLFQEIMLFCISEIIAFPAGGIAAIIIGSIILILIVIKIGCVISGWEDKIPEVHIIEAEDQKFMLAPEEGSTEMASASRNDGQGESK